MLMQARAGQAADLYRRPPGRGRSRERAVRARGRDTVARLLAAGLAEFEARGFQAVTVDDMSGRAQRAARSPARPGRSGLALGAGDVLGAA